MIPDGPRYIDWRPWIELRIVNGRYKIARLVQKVGDKHIVFQFTPFVVEPRVPGSESTHEDVIELIRRALAQVPAAQ